MAAFAILFFPYLWSLVVSQEACAAEQCGFKGGSNGVSNDVASIVQLNVGQSSNITLTNPYEVAATGQSCDDHCGQRSCDVGKIRDVTATDLNDLAVQEFGVACSPPMTVYSTLPSSPSMVYFAPSSTSPSQVICFRNSATSSACEADPAPDPSLPGLLPQRVCYCMDSGGGQGDPHIRSLRGAHYTLLQQGVFIAWNFSKAVPASAVPGAAPARGWQLLAAYAGDHFTTQGLLLLDRSGQSMEITAEDCSWHVKEKKSPWRKAQVELLSADGTTSLQVKKLHEKLGETKMLRSAILLKMMESGSDMKKIANLVVHCRPNDHLDFKIVMFQKSDINHVGGELGVAPDANHSYHFLFSKQGMMRMRADQEFKAPGSWVTLGGSPAGSAYLETKHQARTSLLETQSCGDAQKESARAICAKHLQETRHPQIFADCEYDLCHGGDESFAQSAAAFLSPLEESSA